jgi:hypothetical protein
MIQGNIDLSEQELEIGYQIHNKRIECLIKLGEIKLSEIENEKKLKDIYFELTGVNTKDNMYQKDLEKKHGVGQIDLANKLYVRNI